MVEMKTVLKKLRECTQLVAIQWEVNQRDAEWHIYVDNKN